MSLFQDGSEKVDVGQIRVPASAVAGDVVKLNADLVPVWGDVAEGSVEPADISLEEGKVVVGDADDLGAAVTLSGDVTMTSAGVTAIGAKKVVAAMTAIADGAILIGDAAGAGAAKTLSGDITTTREGVTAIGAGKVTQAMDAPNTRDATIVANLANAAVIPGITCLFTLNIADASGDTDITTTFKVKVVDFWFLNTGIAAHAANDTIQLKSTGDAITNVIAKTATVNALPRAGTIDPATATVAAGGILRVTAVKDTNVAGVAHILCVRVA